MINECRIFGFSVILLNFSLKDVNTLRFKFDTKNMNIETEKLKGIRV